MPVGAPRATSVVEVSAVVESEVEDFDLDAGDGEEERPDDGDGPNSRVKRIS